MDHLERLEAQSIFILREAYKKFGKLGMKVKAKRKWRKARGRHNKIRESKRGHSARPKIGYKADWYVRPTTIENVKQLEMLSKDHQAVISGRVGGKKRATGGGTGRSGDCFRVGGPVF